MTPLVGNGGSVADSNSKGNNGSSSSSDGSGGNGHTDTRPLRWARPEGPDAEFQYPLSSHAPDLWATITLYVPHLVAYSYPVRPVGACQGSGLVWSGLDMLARHCKHDRVPCVLLHGSALPVGPGAQCIVHIAHLHLHAVAAPPPAVFKSIIAAKWLARMCVRVPVHAWCTHADDFANGLTAGPPTAWPACSPCACGSPALPCPAPPPSTLPHTQREQVSQVMAVPVAPAKSRVFFFQANPPPALSSVPISKWPALLPAMWVVRRRPLPPPPPPGP